MKILMLFLFLLQVADGLPLWMSLAFIFWVGLWFGGSSSPSPSPSQEVWWSFISKIPSDCALMS